jgi:hypothetical protein
MKVRSIVIWKGKFDSIDSSTDDIALGDVFVREIDDEIEEGRNVGFQWENMNSYIVQQKVFL